MIHVNAEMTMVDLSKKGWQAAHRVPEVPSAPGGSARGGLIMDFFQHIRLLGCAYLRNSKVITLSKTNVRASL